MPPVSLIPVANLPPVSLIPAANLQPVSLIPVANLPPVSNISANFRKNSKGPNGLLLGWGETDSSKKPEAKNLVTL